MSSLMQMLTSQLGGDTLQKLSRELGTDEKTTSAAAGAAVSTLVGAMARNASDEQGARSLHQALERDHDGSVMDQLPGLLSAPQSGSGDGILRHVLGSKRGRVEHALSQSTGMDSGQVSKLLMTVAPMLMGVLGKTQRQQNLDDSSLSQFLGQQSQQIERESPETSGIVNRLLDTDGDGDVDVSDLARRGMGVLGKLFGK